MGAAVAGRQQQAVGDEGRGEGEQRRRQAGEEGRQQQAPGGEGGAAERRRGGAEGEGAAESIESPLCHDSVLLNTASY